MATEPRIPRESAERLFLRTPRHATYNFNQNAPSLYRNQPRIPFEFYVDFRLNNTGPAKAYVDRYFVSNDLQQIMPLVKSVTMPSFKIETNPLNQYNRKRLSQTKITFDPIKMVFHDVVDGKTLKFWEMYYRYYFMDGNEPGMNDTKNVSQNNGIYSTEIKNTQNNTISRNIYQPLPINTNVSPTSTDGQKSNLQNIVADVLENQNFGFNLYQVQNIRNLLVSIDIYQVHGGRFNQITLVNPRVSAFTHDTLDYSESSKTLELSFTFEYEYAYYIIQNMPIGGQEMNNSSTMIFFERGDYLELPKEQFNVTTEYVQTNNPALSDDNTQYSYIGTDVQTSLDTVYGNQDEESCLYEDSILGPQTQTTLLNSSSSISGLTDVIPGQFNTEFIAEAQVRPFTSTAQRDSTMYVDVDRTAGNA